jgi:hypothetical protein
VKILGLLDKIIHGSDRYRQEKAERKSIEAEARKARLEGFREGSLIGAKKAGRAEGIAKHQNKGGVLNRIVGGYQSASKATGNLKRSGLFDVPAIGSGLSADFGFGLESPRPKRRRTKQQRKKR